MGPLFTVGVFLCFVASYVTWTRRSKVLDSDTRLENFDAALSEDSSNSVVLSSMARIARPAVDTKTVSQMAASSSMKGVAEKVKASHLFGGRIDIFLAYQFAAVLLSAGILSIALIAALSSYLRVALVIAGFATAGFPYFQVNDAVKKMAAAAADELPDFVELLQIALASSMGVKNAVAFTAEQSQPGVLKTEIEWLIGTLDAGHMNEAEAFEEVGKRIGSIEAKSFFSALGQAAVSGAKITETLQRQAESLRNQQYQARRVAIKKIPVKMVVAFTVHFLPLLFAVTMVPLLFGIGGF